eukprot:3504710-Prymnesium_polylepis.1
MASHVRMYRPLASSPCMLGKKRMCAGQRGVGEGCERGVDAQLHATWPSFRWQTLCRRGTQNCTVLTKRKSFPGKRSLTRVEMTNGISKLSNPPYRPITVTSCGMSSSSRMLACPGSGGRTMYGTTGASPVTSDEIRA